MSLNILTPANDEVIPDRTVNVSWEGSDTNGYIVGYNISVNGGAFSSVGIYSIGNVCNKSLNYGELHEYRNTVIVRAQNNTGSILDRSVTFYIDTMPPMLNVTFPTSDYYLNTSTVAVSWTASDASGIAYYEITLDSDYENTIHLYQSDTHYTWTFTDVKDGEHHVTVVAHDASGGAGKTTTKTVYFYVDTKAPIIQLVSPLNGTAYGTDDVTISWNGHDNNEDGHIFTIDHYEVWLNGQLKTDVAAGDTNPFYSFPPLMDGTYHATIVAVDKARLTATVDVTVYVDTVLPTVSITSPSEGAFFNSSSITVTWIGNGTGSPVSQYKYRIDDATSWTSTTDQSAVFAGLSEGTHTVEVRVYDRAGGMAEDSVSFNIDLSVPTVTDYGPKGDDLALPSNITVTFSEPMDHSSIVFTVDGAAGTVSWYGNTAVFTPSSPFDYATTYDVSVTAKDRVGHAIAPLSWSFSTTDKGLLQGVVKDSKGNAVGGATVTLDGTTSVVTNATGSYSFIVSSGQHTLVVIKDGYDPTLTNVTVAAGEASAMTDVKISASQLIPTMGWIVAGAAVVIVAVLVIFSWWRKRERGRPPVPVKSWKGMQELQKRSRKDHRDDDENDERF